VLNQVSDNLGELVVGFEEVLDCLSVMGVRLSWFLLVLGFLPYHILHFRLL
jgi:hypothetical protein